MRTKFDIVLCLFLVNFLSVLASDSSESSEPIVKCEEGKIRGKLLKTRGRRDIFSFLGIPYAKPPVDELRFKPPVPIDRWKGILNATEIHAICPQRDIYRRSTTFEGKEDCLYLNVYSPQVNARELFIRHTADIPKLTHLSVFCNVIGASCSNDIPNCYRNPTKKDISLLPVMVFFHGGGWLCGGGNSMWYGPDVLLDRDIVLVVMNYRLGALGFLSTGDEIVPGNNGLKDQNLALKWIQKNIKYFGGNPKSVTIFGESAGGASVHYHMVSPASRGLFHKGISMSGTALCIWAAAPKNEAVENSKKLAAAFECPTESSKQMIDCLQKLDAMEIVKKDEIFMEWDFDPMIPFKPTIEPDVPGAFLTEHPIDIVRSGRSSPTPFILGITTQDGALRGAALAKNQSLLDELNSEFERVVPISLMYDKTASDVNKVTKEIKKFYFDDELVDWSKKDKLMDMYTDGWFLNCLDETVRLHQNYTKHPVYLYLFGHRGVASFTKIFGGGDDDYGVCHADDLQYLFPVGDGLFPDKKPTEDDKYVAKLFTSLFANFAYTGNPTPEVTEVIPEKWLPVNPDNTEYYYIDAKSPGMRQEGLYIDRAKFWRNLDSNPRHTKGDYYKEEL